MNFIKLLSITLLISLIIGCDSVSTDENITNDSIFKNEEILISIDSTVSKTDTLVNEFTAQAGDAFKIEILKESYDYIIDFYIVTPANDTLSKWDIVTEESGTYKIYSFLYDYIESYTGDYSYRLKVTKLIAVPDSLTGVWVLTEEKYNFNGEAVTYTYNKDNAERAIVFYGDSVAEYSNDVYSGETINSFTAYKPHFYYFRQNVIIGNGTITCSNSNSGGSTSHKFEKISGTMDDITWVGEKEIIVPEEMIGTWYLSYEYELEVANFGTEGDSFSFEISYNSAIESNILMTFSRDSIITWYNEGLGSIKRYADLASEPDNYYNFKSSSVSGSTLKYLDLYIESEDEGYEAEHEEEHYIKYTGTVPPSEWSTFDLPSTSTTLNIGDTLNNSISAQDSIWFKITLSQGEDYELRLYSDDFNGYLGAVTPSKEFLDGAYHYKGDNTVISFTADENSNSFILLTGVNNSESGDYRLIFNLN